jgi:hypothetical protein
MGEKKPFKETKFGKFLDKTGEVLKDNAGALVGIGVKAATGNISGAIADVSTLLKGKDTPEAQALLQELEIKKMEFELEFFKQEVEDRKSARQREIEVLKTGSSDPMMKITGIVALSAFLLCVVTVLFMDLPPANEKLIYHLFGIVEGVSLTVFSYYYGSSKGSRDKTEIMGKRQ